MRSGKDYVNQENVCGTPRDFYKMREVNGKYERYCPKCDALSNKVKAMFKVRAANDAYL